MGNGRNEEQFRYVTRNLLQTESLFWLCVEKGLTSEDLRLILSTIALKKADEHERSD